MRIRRLTGSMLEEPVEAGETALTDMIHDGLKDARTVLAG
jgi:hypothetical protein